MNVNQECIYTKYKGRLIDVKASIKYIFEQYAESSGIMKKEYLREALLKLELDLNDEEYEDAKRAFKDEITLEELIYWWTA